MASSRLERIGTIFTRKQGSDAFLKDLSTVMEEMKEDCMMLKSNQEKLHKLTASFMKCFTQVTEANEQKLTSLNDIYTAFKKQVEGLLIRGGMKADDRPLWFDVYKAFPPNAEPKLARAKPEVKPIRQILYKEDALRAKFHSQGHGLGAVNMLNPSGETPTKKLIQQFAKEQSAGVTEQEIIQKCVDAAGSERHTKLETTTVTPTLNPQSVSAQVLADADLKNIFKDEKN